MPSWPARVREGLLALAVGAGLQVLAATMEDDLTATCGPQIFGIV